MKNYCDCAVTFLTKRTLINVQQKSKEILRGVPNHLSINLTYIQK